MFVMLPQVKSIFHQGALYHHRSKEKLSEIIRNNNSIKGRLSFDAHEDNEPMQHDWFLKLILCVTSIIHRKKINKTTLIPGTVSGAFPIRTPLVLNFLSENCFSKICQLILTWVKPSFGRTSFNWEQVSPATMLPCGVFSPC